MRWWTARQPESMSKHKLIYFKTPLWSHPLCLCRSDAVRIIRGARRKGRTKQIAPTTSSSPSFCNSEKEMYIQPRKSKLITLQILLVRLISLWSVYSPALYLLSIARSLSFQLFNFMPGQQQGRAYSLPLVLQPMSSPWMHLPLLCLLRWSKLALPSCLHQKASHVSIQRGIGQWWGRTSRQLRIHGHQYCTSGRAV